MNTGVLTQPGSVQRPDGEASQSMKPVSTEWCQLSATSLREQTEKLAYLLWLNRGCPDGSAEIDWYEAERKTHGD
jgi:hypothetical protein